MTEVELYVVFILDGRCMLAECLMMNINEVTNRAVCVLSYLYDNYCPSSCSFLGFTFFLFFFASRQVVYSWALGNQKAGEIDSEFSAGSSQRSQQCSQRL